MLHAVERELRDQLVEREGLAFGAWIPAEQREIVDHRLRKVALLSVEHQVRLGMLALRELAAVRREDQRHVRESPRPRVPERVDDQQLVRRVGQVLLAADHVRDVHRGVVDGAREVVCRISVRLHDDEIAEQVRVECHLAPHHVGELHVAAGHMEANREDSAIGGRIGETAPRVDVGTVLRLSLLALGVELLRRAVAAVRLRIRDEL